MGGLIVTYISWRWIFWINVPIGAAALILATRVLHEHGERARRHFDLLGMVTLGLGLFGVLWAMTTLATATFDASVAGYLIGGVVLIERLCPWSSCARTSPCSTSPLFKIPMLAPSLLAALFQGLANFAVLFLVIVYLQGPRGLSPIHASLLLVPGYVVGSGVGPFAGRHGGPVRAGATRNSRARHPGDRPVLLCAAFTRERAVAGRSRERRERRRGEAASSQPTTPR